MRYFSGFGNLALSEKTLIPEAAFQLLLVRIKVRFLSSRHFMPESTGSSFEDTNENTQKALQIARVINGLSWRLPFSATCLVKALAAQKMLKKRKIGHAIHFGVDQDQKNELKAHAWLSVKNTVIIGGESLTGYREISRINIG